MCYAPGFAHSQTHNSGYEERRTVKVSFIEDTDGRVFLVFTNTDRHSAEHLLKANIIVHNAQVARCLNLCIS